MRRDRSGCCGGGGGCKWQRKQYGGVAVVGGDVEECSGDHKELLEDGNC